MSNGNEGLTLENEVANLPVEELQESHEELSGETGGIPVVNSLKIDIFERDSFQDDGECSEQSSCAATPLERSQEVAQQTIETDSPLLLKEWNNALVHLLARIPVKAQRGLNTFDLKLTCISTISEEILVIGTNVGVVYWYNRRTDLLDRLRCEGLNPITSLSCISTVDYMVAAGNQAGLVTIFQIPRDSSQEKSGKCNVTPETYYERKTKKSQQFLVQGMHKGAVTALEWSRNGMKLFSGDQSGHIVLTDIDYDLVQIRSSILLCENYEIVQLSYARKNLLICSTFRSIIYSLETKNFNKVGSLERKVMGKFGGLIVSSAWEESPKVYSVRPGARLWVANLTGVVQHTIKFKELILSGSQSEIHVIKPLRSPRQFSTPQEQDVQFTRIFRFMKDYLVTYYKDILHIVDARNTVVLGICKELRSILDIAVNKDEIFILESSRNVIRLSAKPDTFSNLTSSNFFANFSTSSNLVSSSSASTNSTTSSTTNSAFQSESSPSGMKQTIPDIMSASIADFRFPQEPFNFLTSKFKETSERVIPRINPLINTIKTVIEADVDIEDGQKLLESGIPSPVMIPSEIGDVSAFDVFSSPPPIPPEEPVFVPEPERFQKISNLPFEDVVVQVKAASKKTKSGSRSGGKSRKSEQKSSAPSEVASDSVSVSSAFSNTSGSENNMSTTGVGGGGTDGGISSSSSARKSSLKSDVTFSSGSNSGSEGIMSASEHPYMHQKDQLGIPLSLSQSWSVGTLLPNKTVTTEELHLKEELLARQLKWPELLPESVSADGLFDEPAVVMAAGRNASSVGENNCWQVNLPRNSTSPDKRLDRSSVLTLIGPRVTSDGGVGSGDEDTDSRTLSIENGSSFGTVIEREVLRSGELEGNDSEENHKSTSGNCSTDDDDDDNEDKYYMDIYTRYRNKDSHSVSSFNSVLSFGPPSGSSHVSGGGAAALGVAQNHQNVNGTINGNTSESNNVCLSSAYPEASSSDIVEDELGNSKEKSSDTTSTTGTSSSTTTTEEADSIVEAKIVTDEYWRKWRLPGGSIAQFAVCEKYIVCVTCKGTVYYSSFDSLTLHWKSTNYSASAMAMSPCASIIWRVYRGDLYSLTNPTTEYVAPIGDNGEQWSKLTQKKDVASVTVQRLFGWIVKLDGSLEFCTGLLQTRLIPYFEKVYTPWPIQEVTSCGHRLWALTSDGRVVFRTGTSDLNPKGIDWLEIRWSSSDISSVCSISCGDVNGDGLSTLWFSDVNANLYFTSDERDSKGAWIPWKVAVNNSVMHPSQSSQQQSKSVILSSLREQVTKSFKSLVQPGAKCGLKLCSSKTSVWFSTPESSLLHGNRSSITGHCWKPIRVDRGLTVPSTWVNIYANSVYHGHGNLWISDSAGNLFYLPPAGGKLQQLGLPMFTDGQIIAVAPAPEALWALTSSGDIHGRCDITTTNSIGKRWRQISLSTLNSTQFVHISCGSEVAWAVDDKGEVYMRIGSLRPPGAQGMSPAWNKVETSVCCKGTFTKVYVGANDSMVWALDSEKRVYARQAVFPDYKIGTGWLLVKGVEADMLSISDSAVWALSTNGSIYRRYGITKTNFVGDHWLKIPGNASAIAVSLCDELWALTSEGYLLKHSKKVMELKGWGDGNWERAAVSPSSKTAVLDEEDEDWELVDNSEI